MYVTRFDNKDLAGVAELLDENFVLEDPVVVRIEGKQACLQAIENIFKENDRISFRPRNIYQQNSTSIIEFELSLEGQNLKGVDIIEWQEGRMKQLRAYLDIPK